MGPYLFALLVAALVYASCEIGCRFARRGEVDAAGTQFTVLQTASFGIVSLLLAFSFAVAANRFDTRRAVLVDEANAISETILRADMLDLQDAKAVRADLRPYVQARIDFISPDASNDDREKATQQSLVLQSRVWTVVMAAARRNSRSPTIALLIESINAMTDQATKEATALSATLPTAVLVILVVIVVVTAGIFGAGYGRAGRRSVMAFALLSLILGLVFSAILDFSEPQAAFIRVNLTPLRDLRP